MRIDLNANFRSRQEVLASTNYVFEQIMDEAVGEIDYDEQAALKFGATYPEKNVPVELVILNETEEEKEMDEDAELSDEEDLKRVQKEARYIIARIRDMVDRGVEVYIPKEQKTRPIQYSDIVILMRSKSWAGELSEEFKAAGIPLYADASGGYFEALEVMMMINLLKVIDNPYQDIQLASVLRAPFVGLTENELAEIRLAKQNVPYYEAVQAYLENGSARVTEILKKFIEQLHVWRDFARHGSLADLIWDIYDKTHYFEMVGAMMNGKQRQANLRLLHDRALSYEKSSFRGLFRFLRFIDRMQSRGDDLGVAKSIGEGDNVVRLVTIHSSKGLEFPVVFVADMAHRFNMMDFHSKYIFDQDFGLAVKAIDPENRVVATSLPFLALKEKKIAKLKAEEMRILYVAMTRAKEQLILVGSVKNWEKKKAKWEALQDYEGATLPNYLRASSTNYLEWVGSAVARHQDFLTIAQNDKDTTEAVLSESLWTVKVVPAERFKTATEDQEKQQITIEETVDETLFNEINHRFTARYRFEQAVTKSSKKSVSEIKRIENLQRLEEKGYNPSIAVQREAVAKRPLFMQEKMLTSTEIGTAVHTVMQHIPQAGFSSVEETEQYIESLVQRELITAEEASKVVAEKVYAFFATAVGQRFKNAHYMLREVPFTLSYREHPEDDGQIVQGVIDCMFQDEQGWVLLDYKTDKILPRFSEEPKLSDEMKNRYSTQLRIYTEAIEKIKRVKVTERVLYLYDIGETVSI